MVATADPPTWGIAGRNHRGLTGESVYVLLGAIDACGGHGLVPFEEEPSLDRPALLQPPDRAHLALDSCLSRAAAVVCQDQDAVVVEVVQPVDVPAVLLERAGPLLDQLERSLTPLVRRSSRPLGCGVPDEL